MIPEIMGVLRNRSDVTVTMKAGIAQCGLCGHWDPISRMSFQLKPWGMEFRCMGHEEVHPVLSDYVDRIMPRMLDYLGSSQFKLDYGDSYFKANGDPVLDGKR